MTSLILLLTLGMMGCTDKGDGTDTSDIDTLDDTGTTTTGVTDDTATGTITDETGTTEETGTSTTETGDTGEDTGDITDTGPVDYDGDGYDGTEDCNDADAEVNPGAEEIPYDGVDNDCDPSTFDDDLDGDGYGADEDCDDTDASISPDAFEVCDDIDNNCDGEVDEDSAADASTWFGDSDGDGYGVGLDTVTACDQPKGYAEYDGDCDDTDIAYNPGATEDDCTDPNDYNCDGSTGFADDDGDGFAACEECDDADAAVNPDADEVCDEVDNNCDGDIDEDAAIDAPTWYADTDNDTFGDPDNTTVACDAPIRHVANPDDCDDTDFGINPDAEEVCDDVDQDCDTTIDEEASDASTWYADADGDDWGDSSVSEDACDAPDGFVADSTDCDDADATLNNDDLDGDGFTTCDGDCDDSPFSGSDVNPDATEICDDIDNDCDTVTDEEASDATEWYADSDEDGFGTELDVITDCEQPDGYVSDSTDCNDVDGDINPDADEVCDSLDNNCDGVTDDDAIDQSTWYADEDIDTYGDIDNTLDACEQPDGYLDNSLDCDDSETAINPDADEVCDGIDNDCDDAIDADDDSLTDGTTYYADVDGDGAGDPDSPIVACEAPDDSSTNDDDCDDTDGTINPDADEDWYDSVDSDCDGEEDPSVCDELPPEIAVSYDDTCDVDRPDPADWDVVVEWNNDGTTYSAGTSYTRIMATPVVAQVTDDNGDGFIDDEDMPDILYTTFTSSAYASAGYLRVISGDGSGEHFSVSSANDGTTSVNLHSSAGVAVGDLDGDGSPEIVTMANSSEIVALNADGTTRWISTVTASYYTNPVIADMDGDGCAEVIASEEILDCDGNSITTLGSAGRQSPTVGDFDDDGVMEVVTGDDMFEMDGTVVWSSAFSATRSVAAVDFDGDGEAEFAGLSGAAAYVLESDGTTLWSNTIDGSSGSGGACAADFDGDGTPEFAVIGTTSLSAWEFDGTEMWSIATSDASSGGTGCITYDFNGDGAYEVIAMDEGDLYVVDGATGSILHQEGDHASGTLLEIPTIADVDNDGQAEIIVPNNDYYRSPWDGIYVIGESNGAWASSRKGWQQYNYHPTRYEDAITVATEPPQPWLTHNTHMSQSSWSGLSGDAVDLQTEVLGVCEGEAVSEVYVVVDNTGSLFAPAGVEVALYADDGGTLTVIDTMTLADALYPGDRSDILLFTFDTSLLGSDGVLAVADDDGSGVGVLLECDEDNNASSSD